MKLVLADLDAEGLSNAVAEIGGTDVLSVKTDVSKRCDVEELARRAYGSFGEVHLLFNNAGVSAGGSPWDATWNDWEWAIGVNLWGVVHGVKVFTPLMQAQNTECHIVNTSSAAGLTVGGFSAPYSVTKHAVVALSESMYLALRQRNSLVDVSVLCPAVVRTNIAEVERYRPEFLRNEPAEVTPERAAGLAAFKATLENSMSPDRVADMVFNAIEEKQFYILTHPEWTEVIRLRTEKILAMENPQNPMSAILRLVGRT
jgi:short-subunit dehydrogenase